MILWGHLDGQNPKPYLCYGHITKGLERYEFVDFEHGHTWTLSTHDVNRVIDDGRAWRDGSLTRVYDVLRGREVHT